MCDWQGCCERASLYFQGAMSAKRISQSTFDETVKENMEEFDMCREEATKDAIKQFTTQGEFKSTQLRNQAAGK